MVLFGKSWNQPWLLFKKYFQTTMWFWYKVKCVQMKINFWDEVDCNLFAFFFRWYTSSELLTLWTDLWHQNISREILWIYQVSWTWVLNHAHTCTLTVQFFLAQNKNKSKGILLITVRQPVIRGSLLRCYFCGWDALWRASPCGKGTKLIGTNTLTVGEGFIVNMHLIPPANFTFQLHSTDFTHMTKH